MDMESNYQGYLKSDMSGYIGQWVAIAGGTVIAHGIDVKLVAEQATARASGRKFLLARIPDKESMIF